jgi:archaellum component FlaF (FlaF/FlaG flagellin family)
VEVTVENRGSTALSLNRTDLFFDNEYVTGWQGDVVFDGDSQKATDLWLPGETLTITTVGTPDRVKVASERGVSDAAEVTS